MIEKHYLENIQKVVEIEFERDDSTACEIDEHEVHYLAYGEDESGRKYTANWIQIDGENGITEINNIMEEL